MIDRPNVDNVFSGESGNVVQAGSVHGGVHFHGSRRPWPTPRQLPTDFSRFVNREAELAELDRLLPTRPAERPRVRSAIVTAVAGTPGVGKTALAVRWAHRVRRWFPDGDLYVDLRGYSSDAPVSTLQALDGFLRALDVPGDRIPDSVEARAGLFRSLLDGRRLLIVIDNAASSAHVRQLLPASDGCLAVVTSRAALSGLVMREGAARVRLDVLSPDESVRLLAELVGRDRVDAEVDAARRVARLCGHLPLALRVVAERIVRRPGATIAALGNELADERDRLDALASDEDELSDVRAVFSWSYRALQPELRAVFRLLGGWEGPDIGVGAAAALAGLGVAAARKGLRALADVSLVEEYADDRYRLHDLLRAYALERWSVEETQDEQTAAVRRVATWYLVTADAARQVTLPHSPGVPVERVEGMPVPDFPDAGAATRWFVGERLNVMSVLRQASAVEQFDVVWKLGMAVSGFLEQRAYHGDWEDVHRIGLAAARAAGDQVGEAAHLLMLGDVAWERGRPEEAAERYREAAGRGRELGVGWIEGFAVRGLGLLRDEAGEPEAAAELFRRAHAVFRAHGLRRGEGMALLSIGQCARELGDLTTAQDAGRQAIGVFTALDDGWSVAWGWLALAATLRSMGQTSEAMAALQEAVEGFAAQSDPDGEADALTVLGDVHAELGSADEARACRTRAAGLRGEADAASDEMRRQLEGPGQG